MKPNVQSWSTILDNSDIWWYIAVNQNQLAEKSHPQKIIHVHIYAISAILVLNSFYFKEIFLFLPSVTDKPTVSPLNSNPKICEDFSSNSAGIRIKPGLWDRMSTKCVCRVHRKSSNTAKLLIGFLIKQGWL